MFILGMAMSEGELISMLPLIHRHDRLRDAPDLDYMKQGSKVDVRSSHFLLCAMGSWTLRYVSICGILQCEVSLGEKLVLD